MEYNFDFGGGFEFRPGVSVRRTNAEGEAFSGAVSNTLYSAFARAEYAVGNWRFIAGLRGDQFETPNKGFLSPQVILTNKVSRDLFVRASYGRATRSSLLFETFINVLNTPTGPSGFLRSNFLGNKDLELIVVDNIEIGLRRGVTKKISLDVDLFYTSYSPVIVPTVTGVRLPTPTSLLTTDLGPIAIGTTYRQYGGTLSLYANLDERLKLTASVTVQDLTDITTERQVTKVLPGGVIDIESEPTPEKATLRFDIPRVMALLVADYRPLPFLELHLDANFTLQQTLTINTFVEPKYLDLPSQVVLNLVAGCEVVPGVKVFLNGRNLLASEQRQFAATDRLSRMILAGVNAQF
ncbi:MAG: TonB-dependent receptor [Rhizobacter sp.]|nr:TonB-dependent receptor [Chlorobiales bacterium]